jgi:hypothetical protein
VVMAMRAPVSAADEALGAWIREHQVCWEIAPYFEFHQHQKVQLGLNLVLVAKPPAGCVDDPGRQECALVFERLGEIARSVVPEGARIHVEPFDASFHLRAETRWQPEVELTVEILHRKGTFEPLDEAERRYPAAIEKRLTALGVQERSWNPRKGARAS